MQLSQETVLRFMDVMGPFETFVFRKHCDSTIFSSVLVWVSTRLKKNNYLCFMIAFIIIGLT